MLEIVEYPGGYAARTRHNASRADLTVALAMDFGTAGERLTRNSAYQKYLPIDLANTSPTEAARLIMVCLRSRIFPAVLNISGNGLYTLARFGWSQTKIDIYVYNILKEIPNTGLKVISGGQTGADIAGIVAAVALDISAEACFPKGYLQRLENGTDVFSTRANIESAIAAAAERLRRQK